MKKPTILLFAAAALAFAVAGCSRSEPEAEPTNAVVIEELPEANMAEPLPEATPTPEQNMAAALPAEEAPAPDAQMLDDASATGMTSRVNRGEDEAPANAR